ncbi:MAG TPA: hypothetical protein DCE23_06180, partial [Firmicutes bacterium]|nr:hypothetical protein [Bacillota bacterium]
MKKLKTILNYKYFNLILLSIIVIFIIISTLLEKQDSIYNETDNNFNLIIKDYKLTEEKITLTLKGKEDLIGVYYIKSNKEYTNYLKNLKYGLKIAIEGTLEKTNNNTIPNCFNYKKYLNNKNIHYILKINKIEIKNNKTNKLYQIKNKIN